MNFQLTLTLGSVFGFLAAMLAFVIVYGEYRRQQLSTKRVWRDSLIGATFAFSVVLLSAIALGYLLRKGI